MIDMRFLVELTWAAVAIAPLQASILSGHAQPCITLHIIRTKTAETETSLIFHTYGGRAYRNTLPDPCDGLLGLNDLGMLGMKGADGQLCAGDVVWMKHAGLISALGVGPAPDEAGCKLGSFEPISEMSLTEAVRR